jgi:hypothetical protein
MVEIGVAAHSFSYHGPDFPENRTIAAYSFSLDDKRRQMSPGLYKICGKDLALQGHAGQFPLWAGNDQALCV